MPYVIVNKGRSKRIDKLTSQKTKSLDVSVVVPTFEEGSGIERLITELRKSLKDWIYEIIIVDDDSKDGTSEIIDKESKKGDLISVHRIKLRGIFSALLDGIKIAQGKYIVIMDADFSHPPSKIREMLEIKNDVSMVNCSRFMKDGGIRAPFVRKYSTQALNSFITLIMGAKLTDLTGGFHLIDRDKFRKLCFKYPSIWGEFDLELMWRAKKAGWRIKEIPFVYNYREEGESKSADTVPKYITYGLRYIFRAFKLRFE